MSNKKFSARSRSNLSSCHPDLVKIAEFCIKNYDVDFTVIQGRRTLAEQKHNYLRGVTRTMKSKHLENPSRAFDFIPYPFTGWNNLEEFTKVGKSLIEASKELGILARWGGDWNMNGINDERFWDGGHFELCTPEEIKLYTK